MDPWTLKPKPDTLNSKDKFLSPAAAPNPETEPLHPKRQALKFSTSSWLLQKTRDSNIDDEDAKKGRLNSTELKAVLTSETTLEPTYSPHQTLKPI